MPSRSSSTRFAALAALALAGGVARADGAYLTESFGVASGNGFGGMLGTPLHLRLAIGMRLGNFAIEPWIVSDLQTERDGAILGLAGGDPRPGTDRKSVV